MQGSGKWYQPPSQPQSVCTIASYIGCISQLVHHSCISVAVATQLALTIIIICIGHIFLGRVRPACRQLQVFLSRRTFHPRNIIVQQPAVGQNPQMDTFPVIRIKTSQLATQRLASKLLVLKLQCHLYFISYRVILYVIHFLYTTFQIQTRNRRAFG